MDIFHTFSVLHGVSTSHIQNISERKKNREGMLRTLREQHEFNMVLNNK